MPEAVARPSAPSEIIDPAHYGAHGPPYEIFAELRERAPVAWCEAPGFDPFWAVTSHADIVSLSRQPQLFENAPVSFIAPKDQFGDGDMNDILHELLERPDVATRLGLVVRLLHTLDVEPGRRPILRQL